MRTEGKSGWLLSKTSWRMTFNKVQLLSSALYNDKSHWPTETKEQIKISVFKIMNIKSIIFIRVNCSYWHGNHSFSLDMYLYWKIIFIRNIITEFFVKPRKLDYIWKYYSLKIVDCNLPHLRNRLDNWTRNFCFVCLIGFCFISVFVVPKEYIQLSHRAN